MLAAAAAILSPAAPATAQGWEPTKPVQFVIPAGTGGGADQMARFIQGVVAKNNLMKQPIITVNKGGGAGAEGFLEVKKSSGDPHIIIITLSNLFTTPYATGVPFSWKDLTPVAMLALDQFILWVTGRHALQDRQGLHRRGEGRRRQDLQDGRHRLQAGGPDHHRGAGEADRAEEVHLRALRRRRHGGDPARRQARQLEREQPDRGGLAVEGRRAAPAVHLRRQAQRLHATRSPPTMAWSDIPTCKESGVDTQYQMLRGIFMAPGVKPEHVAFYVDLFKKVMATDDWKKFMEDGAFNQTFMIGRRVQEVGGGQRQAALRPDERGGLPGPRQVRHGGAGPAPAPASHRHESGTIAVARASRHARQ